MKTATTERPQSGGNCYRAGYEKGPWYELKSLVAIIQIKADRGDPADGERVFYKAWIKYPEYRQADEYNRRQGFYGDLPSVVVNQGPVTTDKDVSMTDYVTDVTDVTAKIQELAGQGLSTRKIAAVLQSMGENISHMTVQRRLNGQGELL